MTSSEKELIAMKEKFNSLFNGIPIPTYEWKKEADNLILIDYNFAAEEITHGYVKEFIGIKASEMYKDRIDILEDLRKCVNEGMDISREMDYIFRAEKEVRNLSVNYRFVPPNLVIVYTEDITDQKKRREAEQKLKESEEKYRGFVNNISDIIYELDINGKCSYVSHQLLGISGFSPEEMIGQNVFKFVHPDDLTKVAEEIKIALNFDDNRYIEYGLRHKDGHYVPVSSRFSSITIGEKQKLTGVLVDITLRKKAEQKLLESEEKYKALANLLPQVITETDQYGKLTFVNENALETFGYTYDDFNKGLNALQMLIPEDRKRAMKNIMKVLKREKLGGIEYTALRKDGSTFPIIIYASPIIQKNKSVGLRTIVIDITEQKEGEQKLKESRTKQDKERENLINILNTMGSGVYIVNSQYVVEFINPALERELGPLNGKKCYEYFLIRSKPCPDCANNSIFEGKTLKQEFFTSKINKTFEITSTPLHNLDGSISKLGIFYDITERKKVEEEVANLAKFPSENPNPILRVAKEKIIYINKSGENLFNIREGSSIPPIIQDGVNMAHDTNTTKSMEIELNNCIYSIDITPIKGEEYANVYGKDITERKKAEEKLKESKYNLNERVKELTCLYGLSQLVENPDISLEEIIQGCLDLIPSAFQFPEITCARIKYRDQESKTDNFQETKWVLKSDIKVMGELKGLLEIYYLKEKPDIYEGPFMKEQRALIDALTERLGRIAERMESEQKLKESEEKYRSLVQNIPGMVHRGKPDWLVEMITNSEMISGYSIEEFNSQKINWLDIIHPDDKEKVLNESSKLNEGPLEISLVYRIIVKDGSIRWVNDRKISLFSQDGVFKGVDGIVFDITELKEADLELKESEEKYKYLADELEMILDHIPALVFFKDTENNFIRVNKYHAEAHKLRKEDMQGVSCFDIYPKEQAQAYWDDDLEVVKTGKPKFNIIEPWDTPEGTRWALTSKIPCFGEKGKITGIIGLASDITERINTEHKLKESEEKFRTISEQSLMGICILQDGLIKYANQGLSKIYGYTIEEMSNWSSEEFIKLIHPEDKDLVMEQALKKQEGLEDVINQYQFRAIKKTGETIWIENLSKTILYDGKPADLVTIIDITEKKKAEVELKRLNNLKSELLTRSSHELKTPLMSIKGFTELLLLKYKEILYEDELYLVNEIRKGCFRLETLVEDILKTAELESGTIQLEKSEEDLSLLIRACVNELKGFADSRNQIINLMVHDKLETYLERQQISQAINNLLTNAIKYTPPNGNIEINSEIKEDVFIISIKDSGIGFNEEEKQRIFKRFGKIERYGQGYDVVSEGSGLGLYISKKIIELHGGEIWVESEGRSKGSTFYFSLPIIKS